MDHTRIGLLISEEARLNQDLLGQLGKHCQVEQFHSLSHLEQWQKEIGLLIYVLETPSHQDQLAIKRIRQCHADTPILMMAPAISIPILRWALKTGVDDCVMLPRYSWDNNTLNSIFDIAGDELPHPCSHGEQNQSTDQQRTNYVLQTVEQNFRTPPSLQQHAKALNVSPSRLCHLFTNRCQIKYNQYLTCRRLEAAELLLSLGAMNVTSISYTLGFSSPSHLCHSFKRHLNVSPKRYLSAPSDMLKSDIYLRYLRLRLELASIFIHVAPSYVNCH